MGRARTTWTARPSSASRRATARSFGESCELLYAHIDRITEITGSHRHVAIGSDLDGFVKPTLAGLEHSGCLGQLEQALTERYGPQTAALVASDNALRLLRSRWPGGDASQNAYPENDRRHRARDQRERVGRRVAEAS